MNDLWNNIVGGIASGLVTAGVLGLIAWLWRLRQQSILKELTGIMGRAIQHRNIATSPNEAAWVARAKEIEEEAVAKARQFSPTAGSLVEWLDKIDPWTVGSEGERYVSIINMVIERIRELLERHS